jgi:biopolymer transport protein TolR
MGINIQRGSSRSKSLMSEINVTPFVDVMLVLLIVFMVTAPMLTVGVPVNLPDSNADSLPDDNEPLTVTINAKGEIYVQDTRVGYKDLVPKLLAISKNRTDTRIYVRGDKNLNYGRVIDIMGNLSGNGFTKVALITETKR